MADYIEKEKALKLLTDSMDAYTTFSVARFIYMTARQKIKNLTAADVAPVVHGKWVTWAGVLPKCSVCGYEYTDKIECCDYCGNCGAKMEVNHED